ncbi:MAG: hypothetical protein GY857_01445 [Desulfobacula sp.]|nr:hypothetical protein [Desulfobacula sp.]
MIVHQVKIGKQKIDHNLIKKHRKIYVGCASADLKYRDMLVYCRHRWEFYINGTLDFTTCDSIGFELEQWKQKAEKKICEADGVFMLVSEDTVKDENAVWEIDYAITHNIPIAGVDIRNRFKGKLPEKLVGKMTRYGWEWFAEFINNI